MRVIYCCIGCLLLVALATGAPVFAQAVGTSERPSETIRVAPEEGPTAQQQYLDLLARTGTPLPAEDAHTLQKHLVQLALILPADVRRLIARGAWQDKPGAATFEPDAGEVLLAWWRSQDPLPASAANERLEEHLHRVAHAERAYGHASSPSGFDERGKIYVRYGAPTRVKDITFTDPKVIDTVFQPGLSVSPSDFPNNAFWIYRGLGENTYYIFVEKDGYYRQAETADLLPRKLQSGFSSGNLGQIRAQMTLAVLRSVYQQLAVEHPDFGARYDAIDNFASIQDVEQMVGDTRAGSNVLDDTGFEATVFDLSPGNFVQTMIGQGHSEDGQATWRRDSTIPQQVTEVFRDREVLPLSVRIARFLEEDGTTRTEVYWGPQPGGLRFSGTPKEERQPDQWSPNAFVVMLTAIQQGLNYQPLAASQKPYFITDLPSVQDAAIPAQTMIVSGDTGHYNLALQWDQYRALLSETGDVQIGPQVKVATHHADSLLALNPDKSRLEMSDLKPLVIRDVTTLTEEQDGAEPYPHRDIWPDLPLGFYFEVYHLTYGADDQAHYTVSYEIVRDKSRNPLLRFLGRGDEERTSVSTPYTGQSRTAREYILLDLSEWEGQGTLEIRVLVTDETTGQQITRTLPFKMNS